ncbi:tomoregulin-2-like [Mya arenaria]|uniref:tomoregulin-2-like n=1 Tax=Mya arenaria TaxID=6604 RepID=UPI0022DEA0C6|nr:tomoregulin-2-like [Mya arenaria]
MPESMVLKNDMKVVIDFEVEGEGYSDLESFLHAAHIERKACHGPHCSGPGTGEVNSAIVNLALHYNDDLCLEILLTDCSKHVTQGDEIVCGSNGHTYENHCHFAHARCEYFFNQEHNKDVQLSVAYRGACAATTVALAAMTTTSGAATTAGGVTSGVPASSSMMTTTSIMASTTMMDSTTMMPTSTTMVMATTDPVNSIIANVFCQQMDSINCSGGFNVVCASDGKFYPNDCELSKAKCHDSTITLEPDVSRCSAP